VATPGVPSAGASRDRSIGSGGIINNYRLVDVLGEGTSARVFRGVHLTLDRQVAIKVLRSNAGEDGQFRQRFKREAIASSKITHANVVSVFDFGETPDGEAYLIMEWVPGRSLHRVIASGEKFTPERAAGILRQVALGLGAAHRLGMIHRDLKSGNVMISSSEDQREEIAKIVDFGMVRASFDVEKLTQAGQVLGTPQFMPPEMVVGDEATPQSDLYALGVIAYQMISGDLPFKGNNIIEIMRKQLSYAPPKLPRFGGLEELTSRLLEKDAHARPEGADGVVRMIDALALSPYSPASGEIEAVDPSEAPEPTRVVSAPRMAAEPSALMGSFNASTPWGPMQTSAPMTGRSKIARFGPLTPWAAVGALGVVVLLLLVWTVRLVWDRSNAPVTLLADDRPRPRAAEKPIERATTVEPTARPALEAEPDPEPPASKRTAPKHSAKPKHETAPVEAEPQAAREVKKPSIDDLKQELSRALKARGLEVSEVSSFEELGPAYARWRAAVAAQDPAGAQAALAELRPGIERARIDAPFLKRRLKHINVMLGAAKERLNAEDLGGMENEYLDLVTAARPQIDVEEAVKLLRRVNALEARLKKNANE
jgi:serine/threonine-protein kinase